MTPSNPFQPLPRKHPLTPSTPSNREGVGVGSPEQPMPLAGVNVVPPEPDGSKRDVLGRSDVIFTTHLGATAAPVERCEVSRPVSRAAPLVFLAPVSCSSGPGLAGNHTSPLTASLASLTASLASPAVPLVSPDTGRVPVGAVCEAVSVAVGAVSGPGVTLGGAH